MTKQGEANPTMRDDHASTVHVWSLADPEPLERGGVSAAICHGAVTTVAVETMRACASHGHQVTLTSQTAMLGTDEIVEMAYEVVTFDEERRYLWRHVFTRPREPWSRTPRA